MRISRYKRPYINISMILRVLGWLLLIEAAFMLIPFITAVIFKEADSLSFMWSIGITTLFGLLMTFLPARNKEMGKRDAVLLTASVWLVFSIFGMLPFMLSGSHVYVEDAFFEAMSGFTTTGLSIFPSLDVLPHGILIWRCVMQWIGGLGIILFTLAVLPMLNYQGGIQLFNAEVTGITHDKLRPRVSSTAKGLWMVYIVLTLALIALLLLSDMNMFESICYSLSTMSTGGFAVNDAGINTWNSNYIKIVFTLFMFLGGVNFGVIFNAAHGNFKPLKSNTALQWYFKLVVIASVIMAICVICTGNAFDWTSVIIDPIFQTVSLSTSTGLMINGFNNWGAVSSFLILFLVFFGACAGSTSGGAKIDRFIVVVKNIKNEFYRIMHPNAVLTVRINGKGTSSTLVQKTMTFMLLYVMVIFFAGGVLVCMGIPLYDSFFSVLEAITNAGLGVDLAGEATTYGQYPILAKYILSFVMLVGRLELYTVLVIFSSLFWRK